jgi:hypothetical protein
MIQQTPKTRTMNTYHIEYIQDDEFYDVNQYNIIHIHMAEYNQREEMWNLWLKTNLFKIRQNPIKFQTSEMWNQALKQKYILNHRFYEFEHIFPSEFITKDTFDIVRQFCIPEETKIYYIKHFSDRIWEKRRAFCTIINQPEFQKTTNLNSDVLRQVASFI